jgi:hypothetical protein
MRFFEYRHQSVDCGRPDNEASQNSYRDEEQKNEEEFHVINRCTPVSDIPLVRLVLLIILQKIRLPKLCPIDRASQLTLGQFQPVFQVPELN